ncbi:putative alpha/beta-hydrolase family hydrolase [Streptomyces sp. LBL]|uniref:alpha/beta hydrolase family protein n=1 Tax=Streptomyces sp. LBL TaxID=2940562 RepID=UPI0024742757|nr:alpha/beta family hydrolase [Streptomyces sp. LBL]MDH6629507.1 putative alpha/beta-hydrolase family hydrolase [Streptomyces sp. LBL]
MRKEPTEPTEPAEVSEPAEPTQVVDTDAGVARITWHRARKPRLLLAVSHGAGGGIEARDLQALAQVLPEHGVTVALVEQPWRVAGKKLAPAPRTLDVGWRGIWPAVAEPGLPVISGGRSAGARVACRTAAELGAHAVLALSFPLHPPGRPERSRAGELLGAGVPTLVVQGGNDPFGKPEEFPEGAYELVEVPYGDHGFAVPKRAQITQEEGVAFVTEGVLAWTASLG